MKKKSERELGLGLRVGIGMHLSCWSCAYDCDSCHVRGRRNQSAPAACRSCTQPLLCTGLHSVARDTEPRKTCPGVRGLCSSAVMKREFVQPCARQNSEFTEGSLGTFLHSQKCDDTYTTSFDHYLLFHRVLFCMS